MFFYLGRILQSMYVFFSLSKKVCKILEADQSSQHQGQQDFTNVKTRWISMFFPSTRIYSEYRPLILKIHVESPKNDTTNKNWNVLFDMELILGLPCLVPLFECVHKFIKIAQG
jgi:hypothetical protein